MCDEISLFPNFDGEPLNFCDEYVIRALALPVLGIA